MSKIVLKDKFKSTITYEEIKKYKKQSNSVDPNIYNARATAITTDKPINQGAQRMKKDGFKIATEKTRDL